MKYKFFYVLISIFVIVFLYNTVNNLTLAVLDMPSNAGNLKQIVDVDQGKPHEAINEIIYDHILKFFLGVIGAVAVGIIVYNGFKLVMSTLNEGDQKKSIKNIIYAVIGLIIIIISNSIVDVFTDKKGRIINNINEKVASDLINQVFLPVLNFSKYLVGAIAVAMIVYTGYQYITSAVSEADHKKSVRNITYTIIGLIVIIISEWIVGAFVGGDNVYNEQIINDPNELAGNVSDNLIYNVIYPIINFMKYIVGGLAIALTIYVSIRLISEKENEKAISKWKSIVWTIVGFVIIILAEDIIKIFWSSDKGIDDINDLNQNAIDLSKNIIKVVVDAIKLFIGAIAVFTIIIRGLVLVTTAKEEERKKSISQIVNAIVAFVIIIVSEEFVKIFYSSDPYGGEAYSKVEDIVYKDFNLQVIAIINAIERMIAVIAIAIIVWQGGKMIITPSEDARKKSIAAIISSVMGLIFVIISSTIVAAFYGRVNSDGTSSGVNPEMDLAVNEIIGIVNYALGFLGLVSVIMIIYGGFLYVTSGTNEANKKKAISIIINFIIGVVIIISAYTIVRTIIGR